MTGKTTKSSKTQFTSEPSLSLGLLTPKPGAAPPEGTRMEGQRLTGILTALSAADLAWSPTTTSPNVRQLSFNHQASSPISDPICPEGKTGMSLHTRDYSSPCIHGPYQRGQKKKTHVEHLEICPAGRAF